jgi:hypothetical protein
MNNLQQIVLQETTAPFVRALAQYGTDFIPERQIEIIYSELSDSEQAIWDSFVEMIKTKQ